MKHLILLLFLASCASKYPQHWWSPLPKGQAQWWEIPPDAAKSGEVILSKRNELGILSNFAETPFVYHGKTYASVEGFWQMMKYPENKNDFRSNWSLPHTREEVSGMVGLAAKEAGDTAEKIMKKEKVDWVSYQGERMNYCQAEKGLHYRLIREAMEEKLRQNPEVKKVLLSTGNLKLRADHHEENCPAPEWKYYQVWMDIRRELTSK